MLNSRAKLNPNIFSTEVEQKPIRDGYGEALVAAGAANPNVVVLCADLTESTRSNKFQEKFPTRFFELGVAEQNMAAMAAGLAISGKIPFISSYAAFSPGRNWEQIRTTIAYNDTNVKIAGHHAGLMTGPDGATHEMTEDIAIMRTMPNMTVLVPGDAIEAEKATLAAAQLKGPVYIRFAREKTPVVTTKDTPFKLGKNNILWQTDSPVVAVFVTGTLTHNSLMAAKELEEEEGIESLVIGVHTIKPLDEKNIVDMAKKTGAVVTVEEHQIAGGLGGAIAECLAKNHPTPMEFVGLKNTFGESGNPWDLINKYGMGVKDIKAAIKKAAGRRR